MVVINKLDAIMPDELDSRMTEFKKSFGRKKKPEIMVISAAGRQGIGELISAIERKFLEIEKNEI